MQDEFEEQSFSSEKWRGMKFDNGQDHGAVDEGPWRQNLSFLIRVALDFHLFYFLLIVKLVISFTSSLMKYTTDSLRDLFYC